MDPWKPFGDTTRVLRYPGGAPGMDAAAAPVVGVHLKWPSSSSVSTVHVSTARVYVGRHRRLG
jgi:hypothetical protein